MGTSGDAGWVRLSYQPLSLRAPWTRNKVEAGAVVHVTGNSYGFKKAASGFERQRVEVDEQCPLLVVWSRLETLTPVQ